MLTKVRSLHMQDPLPNRAPSITAQGLHLRNLSKGLSNTSKMDTPPPDLDPDICFYDLKKLMYGRNQHSSYPPIKNK